MIYILFSFRNGCHIIATNSLITSYYSGQSLVLLTLCINIICIIGYLYLNKYQSCRNLCTRPATMNTYSTIKHALCCLCIGRDPLTLGQVISILGRSGYNYRKWRSRRWSQEVLYDSVTPGPCISLITYHVTYPLIPVLTMVPFQFR